MKTTQTEGVVKMDNRTIYSKEELQKIQNLEMDVLQCIIEICNKLNIEYFLMSGTLLGAIRHNGFIPWDDDIDVGMTRENYCRFLCDAPSYLPDIYHLQTPYDNKENPYFYSKIRIDGTKFVEYCNRNLDIHHGVYVDIFPFDEVPDNDADNLRHFSKIQRLIRIFSLRQSPDVSVAPVDVKRKIRAFMRKIYHEICKIIPYKYLVKKLEKEITRYDGTAQNALGCLNFPVRNKEYILKADLYPLKVHKFGNLQAKIPGNADIYLKTRYGDYMKLPPKEEQFGHKPYLIDLG